MDPIHERQILQMLTRLETKLDAVDRELEEVKTLVRGDIREMEKRLGKAENAITEIRTKLAIYGATATLVASTLSSLIAYFIK